MGTTTSLATFKNENPLAKFENIVIGTERTLEFAVQCRARKFLLTSSGAIYGDQPADVTHIRRTMPSRRTDADGSRRRPQQARREFLTAAYGEQHGFDATNRALFLFCRPSPATRHPLRHRELHARRAQGRSDRRCAATARRCARILYAADLVIWLL
jgi:dTDP-glucose 4,6-dehydratase